MSSLSSSRGGGRLCRAINFLVYWPALPKVANLHPVEHDAQYCYCGLVGSEKGHSQRLQHPEYLTKAGQAPTYLPTRRQAPLVSILSISAMPWAYLGTCHPAGRTVPPTSRQPQMTAIPPQPRPGHGTNERRSSIRFLGRACRPPVRRRTTGRRHGKAQVPIMATPRAVEKLGR